MAEVKPEDTTNSIQNNNNNNNNNNGEPSGSAAEVPNQQEHNHKKLDKITALQDGIDSLSLAMFEALRGLRDAVAPESGNLGGAAGSGGGGAAGQGGGNNSNENSEQADSFDEFYQSYQNGDPETLAMVKKITSTMPRKREDFIRIHAKIEMQKDAELVKKLARTVLDKSADIDERVSALPGMHRTRAKQMEYIEALLKENQEVSQKLEEAYQKAHDRRDSVRKFVKENTCAALGIVEDKD